MNSTMTISADECTLIEALQRGDDGALADVHALYRDLVFDVVCRIVVDRRMAEDVTQEVFLYLWRNASRIDTNRGSIRAFIVTVARRRAIDLVRNEENRRRREQLVTTRSAPSTQTTHMPDFVEEFVASDLRLRNAEAVRSALGFLPETERRVIDLVYFHGHTMGRAATATNSPEGTAKTRVRRALRRLAEIMEAQAPALLEVG
jgi:RNA polymerase sigma factor (sigma-70 family)